jgi:hypothetical protein
MGSIPVVSCRMAGKVLPAGLQLYPFSPNPGAAGVLRADTRHFFCFISLQTQECPVTIIPA